MKKISICPVCHSSSLDPFMDTRDYFLTGEAFTILKCSKCSCGITDPQPDASEMATYYRTERYISHSASPKGIINSIYLLIRQFTVRKKYRLIRSVIGRTQGSILDVGCGSGELLHYFRKKKWSVMGIEPDEHTRTEAMNQYHLPVEEPGYLKEIPPDSYDIITLWHSLEHIADLSETLEWLRRILVPGGVLLIAVPNHTSLDATLYGPYWAAWDVPRHLYHFSPRAIDVLMQKHHFRITQMIPMKLDAYYISFLSEKYQYGKTNYARAFKNGWRSNRYAGTQENACSSMIYVTEQENAYF